MKPLVSIVIATYNEETRIGACIKAIKRQNYPQNRYEIIVVDDNSTDKTCRIATNFGARIVTSGYRHIERSKAIGITESKGKYICFIDADIILVEKDILSRSVALLDTTDAFGVQVGYWQYSKHDSLYNRYCALFGVTDPLVYMLKRRGVLHPFEKTWMDTHDVLGDYPEYIHLRLNPSSLRTFGSQGFMIKRDVLRELPSHTYFFHLDSVAALVEKGINKLIVLKRRVNHRYVDSFSDYHRKQYRNINLYFTYKKYRTYSYGIGSFRFLLAVAAMITLVVPLIQSLIGYSKKQDSAWFLHPILSCITVAVYAYVTLVWKINRILSR